MRTTYSEFDGEGRFLSADELFPSPQLVQFILQHGEDGLEALENADEQTQAVIDELVQAGLLERDDSGKLRLTPRMVRGIEHKALAEIFRDLRPGVKDGHLSTFPGATGERDGGTRAYQFGDPLHDLDTVATLRAAMRRQAAAGEGAPGLPIRLDHRDLTVHQVESTTDTAICVLIDLSGSMARWGRHVAAKKVALGLRALVRRFPLDTVDYIGFASTAEVLREEQLALVMPKPITTHHHQVRVRVPLDQANLTHPHFTNLHHALVLARRILLRRGSPNKQVFIITDGQPTAHLTDAKDTGASMLNLIYPPAAASTQATLAEALRCRQAGIRFATFALMEEYEGMEWVSFVEQLTRLTRGVGYYCAAGDLAGTIVESYLSGRKQRLNLGA